MEEPKEENTRGWGGSRQGSGRKKKYDESRTIGLRVPKDVADILDAQPNKSAYVIAAVRAYHKAQGK